MGKFPLEKPWFLDKISGMTKEVFSGVFSLAFPKALFTSFAYYIHEHVTWHKALKKKGKHIRIHSRTSIRNAQNISMGDNVRITMDCCIWAEKNSGITLGNNVLIGPGVKIFCGNHGTALCDTPMVYQERREADIHIGDNVWIGANCVICSGVSIASGAVIAAGAVVTTDVPENAVMGGIPARLIKFRTNLL